MNAVLHLGMAAPGPVTIVGSSYVEAEKGETVSVNRGLELWGVEPPPRTEAEHERDELPFADPDLVRRLYERTDVPQIDWLLRFWSNPLPDYRELWAVWDLIHQHLWQKHSPGKDYRSAKRGGEEADGRGEGAGDRERPAAL